MSRHTTFLRAATAVAIVLASAVAVGGCTAAPDAATPAPAAAPPASAPMVPVTETASAARPRGGGFGDRARQPGEPQARASFGSGEDSPSRST